MTARNTADGFGWVTRVLHWSIALGVLFLLPLGAYVARMEVGFSNFWLFGLHKSIGITVFVLLLVRIVWHRISPPPHPLPSGMAWKDRAAVLVHRSFYVLLVVVPLSGWIGSGATGLDVLIFERVTLPPLAPTSEAWEAVAFGVHRVATKLLFACVVLHVAGGLSRRDGTLRRIIVG